jgi:hypothetical protein
MELFPEGTNPMVTLPPRHMCPICGASPLARVAECETVHWLCRSCGHCWQEAHGHLRRADPIMCSGCATQPRADCFALFAREFPRFGMPDA